MKRTSLRPVFPVLLSSLTPPTACGIITCTRSAAGALAWPDPSGVWIIRFACPAHAGHQPETSLYEVRPFLLKHPDHFTADTRAFRPLAYQPSEPLPCLWCQGETRAGLITLVAFKERPDLDAIPEDMESFQSFRATLPESFSNYQVLLPLCPHHQTALPSDATKQKQIGP